MKVAPLGWQHPLIPGAQRTPLTRPPRSPQRPPNPAPPAPFRPCQRFRPSHHWWGLTLARASGRVSRHPAATPQPQPRTHCVGVTALTGPSLAVRVPHPHPAPFPRVGPACIPDWGCPPALASAPHSTAARARVRASTRRAGGWAATVPRRCGAPPSPPPGRRLVGCARRRVARKQEGGEGVQEGAGNRLLGLRLIVLWWAGRSPKAHFAVTRVPVKTACRRWHFCDGRCPVVTRGVGDRRPKPATHLHPRWRRAAAGRPASWSS